MCPRSPWGHKDSDTASHQRIDIKLVTSHALVPQPTHAQTHTDTVVTHTVVRLPIHACMPVCRMVRTTTSRPVAGTIAWASVYETARVSPVSVTRHSSGTIHSAPIRSARKQAAGWDLSGHLGHAVIRQKILKPHVLRSRFAAGASAGLLSGSQETSHAA